jgi:catalase
MVAALSKRGGNPRGHRRHHAKDLCFTGYFEANAAGAALSTASMLAAGDYPVIGRFAIATGDPMPRRAWPVDREHVDVGTLTVRQTQDEADGPCRDYNYDPTILRSGIQVADDALLAARSSAYAKSFDLRTAEAADYARMLGSAEGPR